jgi:DNA-directed RNA polymerase subunit K
MSGNKMVKKKEEKPIKYTKFEIARMLGARALQIAMGAPILVDLKDEDLANIAYNPIEIAKLELKQGVIPLDVVRKELDSKVRKATI